MLKSKKGITLIALVITIIILIILAGVSISLIGGEDGIIAKAQEAKEKTRASQIKEAVDLADITNEVEENKVTKEVLIAELKEKGLLTEEEETALVESDTITIGDIEIDFSKLKMPQTLASKITSANYGDKVNYSVTVEGVTLDNWRIFYKDETTNEVIMIYGDYLPNSTGLAAGAGLATKGDYVVYSNTNRADLINKLNDTGKWSELLKGNVDLSTKATAKGAVDLETWVASWNAKGYTRLYTAKETGMSDGIGWGYYIGTSENPTSYTQSVSNDTSGYNDTLYFPYKTVQSNCSGYWLASPSTDNTSVVMLVYCDGYVYYDIHYINIYGACPAVYLTSDVYTSGKDASGAWVIE